jgi:hypothetical protein
MGSRVRPRREPLAGGGDVLGVLEGLDRAFVELSRDERSNPFAVAGSGRNTLFVANSWSSPRKIRP